VISKRNKISTYKEIHTYPKEGQKHIQEKDKNISKRMTKSIFKRRTKTCPKEGKKQTKKR
jgi:hypothetical protein